MTNFSEYEEILSSMYDYVNCSVNLSCALDNCYDTDFKFGSSLYDDVNYHKIMDQERHAISLLKQHIQLSIDTFEAMKWYITPLVPPHTPDDLI